MGLEHRGPALRTTAVCWGAEGGGRVSPASCGVDLSLTSSQGQYRTVLYNHWVEKLVTHQVPHTSEPTLIGTLGNPVKIRSWQVLAPGAWSDQAGPAAWCTLGREPLPLAPLLLRLL